MPPVATAGLVRHGPPIPASFADMSGRKRSAKNLRTSPLEKRTAGGRPPPSRKPATRPANGPPRPRPPVARRPGDRMPPVATTGRLHHGETTPAAAPAGRRPQERHQDIAIDHELARTRPGGNETPLADAPGRKRLIENRERPLTPDAAADHPPPWRFHIRRRRSQPSPPRRNHPDSRPRRARPANNHGRRKNWAPPSENGDRPGDRRPPSRKPAIQPTNGTPRPGPPASRLPGTACRP